MGVRASLPNRQFYRKEIAEQRIVPGPVMMLQLMLDVVLEPGSRMHDILFSDTKAREDLLKQILSGKLAGDLRKGLLS